MEVATFKLNFIVANFAIYFPLLFHFNFFFQNVLNFYTFCAMEYQIQH